MLNSVPSMFKARRPKGFTYKPLYYDDAKDRVQQRVDLIEGESTLNKNELEHEIRLEKLRGKMRSKWDGSRNIDSGTKTEDSARRMRLILIMAALGFISYFLFF